MYPGRRGLAGEDGLPTRCRCTRRCAVMPTASTQPLIRCARRGMPAQHCLCCSWGGQNSRAAGWRGLGWSQHSTPRSPHASLLHPRAATTTAVSPMRRIGLVSTVDMLINVGLASRSSYYTVQQQGPTIFFVEQQPPLPCRCSGCLSWSARARGSSGNGAWRQRRRSSRSLAVPACVRHAFGARLRLCCLSRVSRRCAPAGRGDCMAPTHNILERQLHRVALSRC